MLGGGDRGWSGQGYGGPVYSFSGIQPWGMAPTVPNWGAVQQSRPEDGRARRVARYPCDNCNKYGHWKYSPECWNYHVHLQQLVAKAAALQDRQKALMGSGATAPAPEKSQVTHIQIWLHNRDFGQDRDKTCIFRAREGAVAVLGAGRGESNPAGIFGAGREEVNPQCQQH